MDIASEAKRRAEAMERITVSANVIGDELGLTDLAAALETVSHRIPQYKQLFQLEAVADLLEAVQRKVAPNATLDIDASPVAISLAEENEIDLATVADTGARTQAIADAEANSTPAALELAQQHNIDLTLVTGTGTGGKITVGDVKAAMEQP